jgi:endonuclease/exonuclease/phosphatase family metal-dependent hydrolase
MPTVWPYIDTAPAPVHVKVLSYNLYWWHLFRDKGGNEGSAGKLIAEAGAEEPFDIMGFQECENPGWVLHDANLLEHYTTFLGPYATCVAFRHTSWALLAHGDADVAEDGDWLRDNYWSKRTAHWLRLRHISSNRTVFFVNHHGPLPLHSGGLCGGAATAYNLLRVINSNGQSGDAVILAGDFNANGDSMTVRSLATQLRWVYQGKPFGGVDNFFTNMHSGHVNKTYNYGGGGSDHDALGITFDLSRQWEGMLIPAIP